MRITLACLLVAGAAALAAENTGKRELDGSASSSKSKSTHSGKKGKGRGDKSCFEDELEAAALGTAFLTSFWYQVSLACPDPHALDRVLERNFDDDVTLTPPGAMEPAFTNLEELKAFAGPDLVNRCATQLVSWVPFEAEIIDYNFILWKGNEVRVSLNDDPTSVTSRFYGLHVDKKCKVTFNTIEIFAEDRFDTCGVL